MAKWGNCDYKQLQQLRENIAHLQGIDMDKFCKDMSKELARKLLQLVIRRTPVGRYDGETYTCAMGKTHQAHTVKGKVGGTLRRGWTAKSQGEAESGSGNGMSKVASYAAALPVKSLAMPTLLRSSTLWNMPAMLNTATAQPKAAGCLGIISSHCLSRTLKALPLLRLSESWNSS